VRGLEKRAMTRRVVHKSRTNARQWGGRGRMRSDGAMAVASSKLDDPGWHRMGTDRNRFAVNRKVHGSSPCSGASFEFRFVRIISGFTELCRHRAHFAEDGPILTQPRLRPLP
jgi:hypothetical protein